MNHATALTASELCGPGRSAQPFTMDVSGAHIAHEVNQPLAAILINANVAMLCLAKTCPDLAEAREAIEDIIGNTERASAVVRGVRDFIREAAPVLADLDIAGVIEDALQLLHFELRRHAIVVETDLAVGLGPIKGDRVQLERVVVNLVKNAVEAMSAVRDWPRKLRIVTRLGHQSELLVAVEDSGTGIDPANIRRIFDPLFTSKRDGMGLGLSMCRSIVEAHGGRLWASPNRPHGSVFSFVLPSSRRARCMALAANKGRNAQTKVSPGQTQGGPA